MKIRQFLVTTLAALTLSLGACAVTPTQKQVEIGYIGACATYGIGFNGALQLRQAGKLSSAEIDQLTSLTHTITPLCNQKTLPSDLVIATQQVTQAATTAVIKAGAAYVQAQQKQTQATQVK